MIIAMLSKKLVSVVLLTGMWIALLIPGTTVGKDYKIQIGGEIREISQGAGTTDPVILYNGTANEYLVFYTRQIEDCNTAFDLRAQRVDGNTGLPVGGAIYIAKGDNNCGSNTIADFSAAYDTDRNQYLVFFNAIDNAGSGFLSYILIDGSSWQTTYSRDRLAEDLLNPFQNLSCVYSGNSGSFTLAYHKVNGAGDGQLNILFVNASNGQQAAEALTLNQGSFTGSGLGVHYSTITSNTVNNKVHLFYEVQFDQGSEIWGSVVTPAVRAFNGSPFRVSSVGAPTARFRHPSVSYDPDQNRLLVAYEKVLNEGILYSLASKLYGQTINAADNTLLTPKQFEISLLPFVPTCITCGEQVKRPVVGYSTIGKEHFIAFYGVRPASQEDIYGVFGHRIDALDNSLINDESYLISPSEGTSVAVNKTIRSLALAHNPKTNQFLIGWLDEPQKRIDIQIRKLENNPPMDILLSANAVDENLPEETEIGDLATIDPDPDDSHSYTIADLAGKSDASYLKIESNKLLIAKNLNYEESDQLSFRIIVSDSKNDSFEKTFQILVNDLNDDPDAVSITNDKVTENSEGQVKIGDLGAIDQDTGDTHTFQLLSHSQQFEIRDNSLFTLSSFNHELTPEINLSLRCRDNNGGLLDTTLKIEIEDVNEDPYGIELESDGFHENMAIGTESANLLALDEDLGDEHTFSLVAGPGDADNNSFKIKNNTTLQTNIDLDYESKSSYSIRLKTIDKNNRSYEGPVAINVINVNEEPTNILLSNSICEEGSMIGKVIGLLSVTDPDQDNDTHTYAKVSGSADIVVEDDGAVLANAFFDFDPDNPSANERSITVLATDQGGLSTSRTFVITIIEKQDHQAPVIVDVDNNALFDDKQAQKTLEITVADDDRVDSVIFLHKGITQDKWEQMIFTNLKDESSTDLFYSTIEFNISKNYMDELGLAYRFYVVDGSGNDTISDEKYIYRLTLNRPVDLVHNGQFDGTMQTYRMIAVPFRVASKNISEWLGTSENLGGYDPSNWRLFHYDGYNGQFKEYPQFSTIDGGKGYWFNASGKTQAILDTAVAPAYNQYSLCTMNLRKGWNQIGNPYPFDLSWEKVIQYNNLDNIPLYLYSFGYTKSDILPAFSGGFVYLSQAATLTIPFARPSSSGRKADNPGHNALDDKNWVVDLQMQTGAIKYDLGGFGMHPEASDADDHFDEMLLPRFLQYADYFFSHPEHDLGAFARDIVPTGRNHIWELTASSNSEAPTRILSWDNSYFGNNALKLLLYDIHADLLIDMRNQSSYSFESGSPRDFKILYGSESWMSEMMNHLKIDVHVPYPNPFTDNFEIPLQLPKSRKGYQVEIVLTNLYGNEMLRRSITMPGKESGTLSWEDLGGSQTTLKPGIYIYSLQIQNGNFGVNKIGKLIKN